MISMVDAQVIAAGEVEYVLYGVLIVVVDSSVCTKLIAFSRRASIISSTSRI